MQLQVIKLHNYIHMRMICLNVEVMYNIGHVYACVLFVLLTMQHFKFFHFALHIIMFCYLIKPSTNGPSSFLMVSFSFSNSATLVKTEAVSKDRHINGFIHRIIICRKLTKHMHTYQAVDLVSL